MISPEAAIRLFAEAIGALPSVVEAFLKENEDLRDAPPSPGRQRIDAEIDAMIKSKFKSKS